MARKSERLSTGASKAGSTHKRTVSSSASAGADAKRSKTKAAPIKSHYFTSKDEEDNKISNDSQSEGEDGSEFDELESEEESPESDDADDYDQDSEKESKSRKGSTQGKRSQSSTAVKTKGTDVWRTGVKAGLGPGNEVVIKRPKARAAGSIPYSDESIHPNTFLFLQELKENNNREWLKRRRGRQGPFSKAPYRSRMPLSFWWEPKPCIADYVLQLDHQPAYEASPAPRA
ncbi:hypothetical protein D0865_05274 [Hortaea werneckii]|uniref:Uncharacterized protein n=1 Tax=Hortaea werneckii TaxID=91943 RepID=A0A3M7CNG7_HORWE|nr:hypothetical protein D0865_05274 [Hortaea werneckii]